MYKIRLTDSVTIQKFSILKPEVEMEFQDSVPKTDASERVYKALDIVVEGQLLQLARRMSKQQKQAALADVSVDDRFKQIIKDT